MKTVAYVIRPAEGGMITHLLDLIRHLDRDRFTPIVLSPPGNNLEEPVNRLGAELIEVDIADRPSLAKDAVSIGRLATALTAIAPDIIHAHSNKAALLTELSVKRGSLKTPIVFSVHNFPSYIATGGVKGFFAAVGLRRVLQGADSIIAVSESLKDYLVEVEHTAPDKVAVVHNGVDAAAIAAGVRAADGNALRASLGLGSRDPVVGTISRLIPSKGIDVLIACLPDLVHKFPGLKAVIVGSGPLEMNLKAAVAARGLAGSVIFTGRVDDTAPYYSVFDVFALPTKSEAFGISVLEAMAGGVPVVASRIGGVGEIVQNRETGLLVPAGDATALAAGIRTLLSDNRGARKMAAQARSTVAERFSVGKMVRETEEVYAGAAP